MTRPSPRTENTGPHARTATPKHAHSYVCKMSSVMSRTHRTVFLVTVRCNRTRGETYRTRQTEKPFYAIHLPRVKYAGT
jgi:hypothetical protein